jgi:hypothetical protein
MKLEDRKPEINNNGWSGLNGRRNILSAKRKLQNTIIFGVRVSKTHHFLGIFQKPTGCHVDCGKETLTGHFGWSGRFFETLNQLWWILAIFSSAHLIIIRNQ